MDSEICNLYNLNIINLNDLINKKIHIEIENFLYDNNLVSLSKESRDRIKIYKHFIIINILNVINENYTNIFLYSEDNNLNKDYPVSKIMKLLNLNIFEYSNSTEIDNNTFYKFKSLADNKKTVNIKKIKQFLEKNELNQLSDKIKNNVKTKLLLYK
jgi:hypothetical protein